MRILYIDTSSDYLYSAIANDNEIICEIKEKYGTELSKEALPQIVNLFNKATLNPQDINKIIVVNGPGSFTGIRIGITIAKTMSWALKTEIIPISGLAAMALSTKDADFIMPLIDARRGYVFGAIYDKNLNKIVEDTHIKLEELLNKANTLFNLKVVTNNEFELDFETVKYNPDILKIVNYYKDNEGINPHLINPCYLKKTEAEEKAGL